jgi:hypothetical protein
VEKRILTIKSGSRFHEPRSLADLLQASVDYNAESARQAEALQFVDPATLPSDYQLRQAHYRLDRLIDPEKYEMLDLLCAEADAEENEWNDHHNGGLPTS